MTLLVDIFQERFDKLFEVLFDFCDLWIEVYKNTPDHEKRLIEKDLQNAVLGEFLDYTEFSMKPWKQKFWTFILRRLLTTRRIKQFLAWVIKTFNHEEDYYDWRKEKSAKELVINAGIADYFRQCKEDDCGRCNCDE